MNTQIANIVIVSTTEKDNETGESLYWSNKYGWVDITKATYFTEYGIKRCNLPADSYAATYSNSKISKWY